MALAMDALDPTLVNIELVDEERLGKIASYSAHGCSRTAILTTPAIEGSCHLQGGFRWQVALQRSSLTSTSNAALGLELLDRGSGVLKVVSICPEGLAAAWNSTTDQRVERIMIGDSIEVVNGASSVEDMLKIINDDGASALHISLHSSNHFRLTVQRVPGHPLGVRLLKERHNLVILALEAVGTIVEWNAAFPENSIFPGDRIVAVNGSSGDPIEMMEIVELEGVLLDLVLARI